MPHDNPDPTDPMALHCVAVETDSNDATVEMAACFIEEYARLGFAADRILRMFHTPGYAGPAMALRALGEDRICALIADEMALRSAPAVNRNCDSTMPSGVSLPVLEMGC